MDIVKTSTPGVPGVSAYQAWLAAGNTGTAAQFLASLIGPAGQSAYQVWLAQGNTGTIQQFLASLAGPPGEEGPAGPQGVPGANARWVPGTPYKGFVSTGCACPTSNIDAGQTGNNAFNARSILTARAPITQVSIVLANWRVLDANGGEAGCGSDCTIHASIEYPVNSGTVYPLTWSGQNFGTLHDWTTAESDIATLPITIPAGAEFAVKENRVYTGSFFGLPVTGQSANPTGLGACFEFGASTAIPDRTLTPGAFPSTANGYHCTPLAVIGETTLASYGFCGDSRTVGFGEFTIANTDPYSGFLERSIGPTRGYSNLGKVSETFSSVTVGGGYALRQAFLQRYATHIIVAYGVNDIYSSTTTLTTLINMANQFRAMFPSKWAGICTVPMENESTDNWSTIANQSFNQAKESQRWALCNAMRAGDLPYYDAVFDPCTILEHGALNSSIWNVPGWTPDGTHLTVLSANDVASGGVFANIP